MSVDVLQIRATVPPAGASVCRWLGEIVACLLGIYGRPVAAYAFTTRVTGYRKGADAVLRRLLAVL